VIFCARNEDGIPTWQLVLSGDKTTTRRIKPMVVGKEFAIQPGRGKFAVCRGRVLSCINSLDHWKGHKGDICGYKNVEAALEGFNSWRGLMGFFENKDIVFGDTFRIEFEVIKV